MKLTRAEMEKLLHPKMPADLNKALSATPKALKTWESATPIARRDWILWLNTAKQAETRVRRIQKALDVLSKGKKRVCCFGGLNWLIKNNQV